MFPWILGGCLLGLYLGVLVIDSVVVLLFLFSCVLFVNNFVLLVGVVILNCLLNVCFCLVFYVLLEYAL